MANTAPKVAEQERLESLEVIDQKAQLLVNWIKQSKHFIVFTGAGISTSAGEDSSQGISNERIDSLQGYLISADQQASGRSSAKGVSMNSSLSTL